MKQILVVGATSAMAEHCARIWAARGAARLVLVGRQATRLEAIAQDLRVRGAGVETAVRTLDFEDPQAILALVEAVALEAPIDLALIAHGHLPDQSACEADLALLASELSINGLSPVLFAEAIVGAMQRSGRGALAVIGSVAGDRGRKSNYVYGAAKGLLERYVEGLQHRLASTGVRVTLVKPGPTDTPMTAHLKQGGARLADVHHVARDIVGAVEAGRPVVYTPGRWALIMRVIRLLPRFVFNRLDI
ncbi:MAG: SDR family NAD(P)-dependent oxidoreductase [Mitsuaria chitosanitabida]|uniref:SDR family NAD(P)-dependent oxidoreductase n=1 Tax=Roseateles chitosanitabidus TaxID=65048 RepID=UPI001B1CDC91|nr:SDR family NAD(P)-dependent oxidoreductase [Roseateles chitosanitabidus]MBO9688679.1 SDR family NAD(P)-dependent oxidoreductase [Roseateles chitosanitabidus]